MTAEQLEWFSEESQRLSSKVLRIYSRRAALGFAILLIGFFYNACNNARQWDRIANDADSSRNAIIASGNIVAVEGCNRDFNSLTALRGVLLASQDFATQAFKRGTLTQTQLNERLDFYAKQLANLQLPDCRRSAHVLTDRADAPLVLPQPLHPTPAPQATP